MAKPDVRIRGLALIDGFVIDCLLSDNHTFESEITEFPVENGSTISDNIRNKPLVVAMECIVSNTPLEEADQFRADGSVPADDAYAMLKSIRRDRRLVQIATSLDHFDNMGLESLTIPRAAGRGDELRFTATFKQVQIVQNKRETRVAIPAARASTSEYPPVEEIGTQHVLIDLRKHAWYDDAINAWRFSLSYQTPKGIPGIGSPIPAGQTFSRWVLEKQRPIEMTEKEWDNRTVAQDQDPVIRKLILQRRQAGTVDFFKGNGINGPVFPSTETRLLFPNEYLIENGQIFHG